MRFEANEVFEIVKNRKIHERGRMIKTGMFPWEE